jgi:1-acyl-sn-glycerol-3-phosphate acyltransferase
MMNFLPGQIIGVFSLVLYILNTLFWSTLLFAVAILKFICRLESWQKLCNLILNEIAACWIAVNNANLRLTKKITWDVRGIEELEPSQWYLVLSNHQSWVDILVLQKVFHRKIPFLKFFLKKELIWVPVLGLAWWALEFPFMKRYSKEYLEKYPHKRGKDLEITKKACRRFKKTPISIMNFVEGTRFTEHKHKKQDSPYMNLLRPKAGGVAFVLSAMGEQLNHILNVTIVYPRGVKSFWDFICTGTNEIIVHVDALPITPDLVGDYSLDPRFREHFQEWLNVLWTEKDLYIEGIVKKTEKAA